MVKVIWAPSAITDIDNIARYIAKDSPLAADTTVELFFDKALILHRFPHYGKPVPETGASYLREILISRYRLIYEVISDVEVHILAVHHQSRLLKNNPTFKKRLKK